MIKGFEHAVSDVQANVAQEINWFTPTDKKHFDPVTTVIALTEVLLTAFLAGFTEEAKKSLEGAGRAVFRRLKELVTDIFGGKKVLEKEDLNLLAREAPSLAQSADPDQLLIYVTQTEDRLRMYLEVNMPPDRAATLAATIRESAMQHILMR